MSEKSNPELSEQTPAIPPAFQRYDDEIDLLEIWRVVVVKRKIIIAITLLATLLAVGYALLAPRTYKAEAYILPPQKNDVEQLNFPDINKITVDEIYAEAIKNLQSLSLRRRFFDEHNLAEYLRNDKKNDASEYQIFIKKFHEALLVHQGKKDRSSFVTVSLEGREPGLIASWVNDYLVLVDEFTVDELIKTLKAKIKIKKEIIDNNIQSLRGIATDQRSDEIVSLEESDLIEQKKVFAMIKTARMKAAKLKADRLAVLYENISIAESLGLDEGGTSASSIVINTSDLPLYTRGAKALRAEAKALEERKSDDPYVDELRKLEQQLALLETNERAEILRKRKNDDPYIDKLRDLQKQMAELNQIDLTKTNLNSFSIDQPALMPEKPIKPKRRLIVLLGLMLGLALGLFCAFIVNYVESNRGRL